MEYLPLLQANAQKYARCMTLPIPEDKAPSKSKHYFNLVCFTPAEGSSFIQKDGSGSPQITEGSLIVKKMNDGVCGSFFFFISLFPSPSPSLIFCPFAPC